MTRQRQTIQSQDNITAEQLASIHEVSADDWNGLLPKDYPFLHHAYLRALEDTGCVGEETGWIPQHLILKSADQQLLAAMPLYIKKHSYGEFVFDFSWANASHQAGLHYYPKWLCAVPFAPVTGPRLLATNRSHRDLLIQQLDERWQASGHSSLHLLFLQKPDHLQLTEAGYLMRRDCQYYWFNKGYENFDDFLAELPRKQRKEIRRERLRVTHAGIQVSAQPAHRLSEAEWDIVYDCYARTYFVRGQHPYLNLAFLKQIATELPDQVLFFIARKDQRIIAAALAFRNQANLYGRHWGCIEEHDCLHFETCYYAAIQYCIEQGLRRFDAGAGGEHKLRRGFTPVATHSAHRLAHPGLNEAVDRFLQRETPLIDDYIRQNQPGYKPEEQQSS